MEDKLIIRNSKGEEITYDVLFTFESEDTKKVYVTYTNYEKDEKGNLKVYSSCYDISDETRKLQDVTTKKEMDVIEEMLKNIRNGEVNE